MQISVKRPKYLNLMKIRLPVTGMVSIAHRISGVLMFIAIPFMVYLLHLSASGSEGFVQSQNLLQSPVVKPIMLLLIWSVYHHLFAGIRFILIDVDVGVEKPVARVSAMLVLIAGLLAALLTLMVLF